MFWYQGAQNIGLSNRKLKSALNAKVHHMITMHACPRQTDRRTNIMAIARRFVLMNASRAKNHVLLLAFTTILVLLSLRVVTINRNNFLKTQQTRSHSIQRGTVRGCTCISMTLVRAAHGRHIEHLV